MGKGSREAPNYDDKECAHFMDVAYSIAGYEGVALHVVAHYGHKIMRALADPGDRAIWGPATDPQELVAKMQYCVRYNQQSLMDGLVCGIAESVVGPPGGLGARAPPPGLLHVPPGYDPSSDNLSKARSTIKQFVRDWGREGADERARCYGPLLEALERHVPKSKGGKRLQRVLTPGSGLGRLTFDAARKGYFAEGNEFSYHMLLGTMWVLNETEQALGTTIYPYVLDIASRKTYDDHLRPVLIPDICPSDFCDPRCGFGEISMRGGEFVECYKQQLQEWDAILTAFFIDTANNIFLYIRTFAAILRPGGLWANVGPLLWHYSPLGGNDGTAVSIELSWEEVRPAIERYFDIVELERKDAGYTGGLSIGSRKAYNCVFFAATRNRTPVEGESNPV